MLFCALYSLSILLVVGLIGPPPFAHESGFHNAQQLDTNDLAEPHIQGC